MDFGSPLGDASAEGGNCVAGVGSSFAQATSSDDLFNEDEVEAATEA